MKLEGFESTRRALLAAPELARVHSSSAVATSTFAVAQGAKALVRVDTGKLRNAIGSSRTVNGLTGTVGLTEDVPYWRHQEFGTIHMPARPAFRPAAENERAHFIERMRQVGPKIERDLAGGRFV
jgi:HK97 gp10 family phage protein